MIHSKHSPRVRAAAMSSGTLFGITLAIVAGLVVATGVKIFILDQRLPPEKAPVKRELTVAAVNILDKTQIGPKDVKIIQVSAEEYEKKVKEANSRKTRLLKGNQPISRTTVTALRAEEPIFEDALEEMAYPKPVSEKLGEGMRAVIIEVPAKESMVQVDDHVDVVCTISNNDPAMGKASTNTAPLARNAKVVARFNTTQTAARPKPGDTTRTYTLEVTPYRFALIELAKSVGGKFSLSVSNRAEDKDNTASPAGFDPKDPRESKAQVTTKDLAAAFGLTEAIPPKIWVIETYNGTKRGPDIEYKGYDKPPPKDKPDGTKPTPDVKEAGSTSESSVKIGREVVAPGNSDRQISAAGSSDRRTPARGVPNDGFAAPPRNGSHRVALGLSEDTTASSLRSSDNSSSFGFQSPTAMSRKAGDCPTCGKKK